MVNSKHHKKSVVPLGVPVFLTSLESTERCRFFYNKDRNQASTYCGAVYDDQLWIIAEKDGKYTITNYYGKTHRLFSNKDGRFGYYGGAFYADQLWDIKPQGNYFFITGAHSGKNLFINAKRGQVSHYGGTVYEDQKIRIFIPKDQVAKVSINYDHGKGKVVQSTPVTLRTKKWTNTAETSRVVRFRYNIKQQESDFFKGPYGVALNTGTTFKAGIPLIKGKQVTHKVSKKYPHVFGQNDVFQKSHNGTRTVTVNPKTTATATLRASKVSYSVPFRATVHYKTGGYKTSFRGVLNGVTHTNLRITYVGAKARHHHHSILADDILNSFSADELTNDFDVSFAEEFTDDFIMEEETTETMENELE